LPTYPYEKLTSQFEEEIHEIRGAMMKSIDKAGEPLMQPPKPEDTETGGRALDIAAESKFHDDWRDFLLTEEKL